jgi:DMSO/TMAO reductase YedYZ heme-binding membrane subunit
MKAFLKPLFAISLMVLVTAVAFVWTTNRSLLAAPAQQSQFEQAVRVATLVLAMLAGVLSSFLFERLKPKGTAPVAIGTELSAVFHSAQFFAAVIVAPLVFNGIYVSVSQNPQGLTDYILAYQNGFFWQAVFDRLRSDRPQ